ncbi:MAG: bifunctional [glutamine synthetase] adenylyltransferase/[glutamine synthetase]-adenylyl-L-tyrosine phosphorylase [Alphaproteobacteria bacterium]
MQQKRFDIDSKALPALYDAGQAARGREAWVAALQGCDASAPATAAADRPDAVRLLDAVFSSSPFLSGLIAKRPRTVLQLLADGPEAALAAATGGLAAQADGVDEPSLMRLLRLAKQDVALITALADLAGAWPLERVTAALTAFADTCVRLSVDHLIAKYAGRGAWQAPAAAPAHAWFGLVTLAMGKLGAGELNYSSDIDLVLLYDPDRVACDDIGELPRHFNKFSHDLNAILEARTADGYVFRTDLRLRPDPGATPPVISLAAAENYYHSVGQTWERAAMIKARAITGAPDSIAAVRAIIDPFVWRRHLDFWAIEDVHAIKQQIHAHKGGGTITVAGHNIKLGRGGIREIEFFAQTQQLIWAGREPALRVAPTVQALDALVAGGHVSRTVADVLAAAYRYLRKVEHRLQMVDDQQTHSLPDTPDELRRIACLMGEPDVDAFTAALTGHMRAVNSHYADLFEETELPAVGGNLVFTGTDLDPGTAETLTGFGYRDTEKATELVRAWFAGRYRATRSKRAQALMNRLVPVLLQAVGRTADPDAALLRFDRFLQGLPSGVQLFSLFTANPELLSVLAEMMGSAPRLADYLAQHAGLMDAMLAPGFFTELPGPDAIAATLESRLAMAADFEGELDAARAATNEIKFQANLQLLRGTQTVEQVSDALSDLAAAAIAALLPRVVRQFAPRYGDVPGGAFAVLALGRLGSREMTAQSDLDLVFIYDAPPEASHSTGPKEVAVSAYYAQLSQRLVTALSAPTASGRLYEVDMRLRPSGNAGPVAVSLAGFAEYQHRNAWTWEHMALTRGRVVASTGDLAPRLEKVVREVLQRSRERDRLAVEVDDMRGRVRKEFGSDDPWDVKQRDGGLVDVEFICQFLMLAHAEENPECLAPAIGEAVGRLAAIGALTEAQAGVLTEAQHLWHSIQAILRLTVQGRFDPANASADQKDALARATGAVDFDALVAQMARVASRVEALYRELVGAPATAGREAERKSNEEG